MADDDGPNLSAGALRVIDSLTDAFRSALRARALAVANDAGKGLVGPRDVFDGLGSILREFLDELHEGEK